MDTSPRQFEQQTRPRAWWLLGLLAGVCVVGVTGLAWWFVDAREATNLARDTRLVVRFPESVIDQLTSDEIREEFEIRESAADLQVTGTAQATGRVTIRIRQHAEQNRRDDAMVHVRVRGEADNELIGHHPAAKIVGEGRGTFDATQRVHFDGLRFATDGPASVTATHETEIIDITPVTSSPLQGAVRLLASRRARSALPELNQLAAARIEELVGARVDALVGEAVAELNRLNMFDETVARLHPDSDDWRIDVASRDGFVQAALVPEGAGAPELPAGKPSALEFWMRLTRTQRAGVNLLSRWRRSHDLFRQFVPDDVAQQMPEEIRIAQVEGWTRVRLGPTAPDPDQT